MSDLIDRQDAIYVLSDFYDHVGFYDKEIVAKCIGIISKVPSAQPDLQETQMSLTERKKGVWIDGHCSICGCDVPAYIMDWKWQKDMDAKYCPCCGAYMKGDDDD